MVIRWLHALLEPLALGLVGDGHVLDAERVAVGQAQLIEQILEGAVGGAEKSTPADVARQVLERQAELGEFQQGMVGAVMAKRIDQDRPLALQAFVGDLDELAVVEGLRLERLDLGVDDPTGMAALETTASAPPSGGEPASPVPFVASPTTPASGGRADAGATTAGDSTGTVITGDEVATGAGT